jgi:hypothetical protein
MVGDRGEVTEGGVIAVSFQLDCCLSVPGISDSQDLRNSLSH